MLFRFAFQPCFLICGYIPPPQNAMAFHGQGIYFKSLAQRKPDFTSISEAHRIIIDTTKNTPFKANLIFDYYPMHTVRSVPNGVTAFRREDTVAAIVIFMWKAEDDMEGKYTDRARAIANEIAEVMNNGQRKMLITESESQGYSNYGMLA
jgi:hypothetical protein